MPVDYEGPHTQRITRFSAMNSDGSKRDRNSLLQCIGSAGPSAGRSRPMKHRAV